MANGKVQLADGTVLVDLTSDTVNADKLVAGETAHNKAGELVTGTLKIQHYYTGTTPPNDSLGEDGDIYLQTGG